MFVSTCFLFAATFSIALLCLRLVRKWRVRRRYARRRAGPCYLCGGSRGPDWQAHRRRCAGRHRARLSGLYRHPWARCPYCGEALALMPCSPHDFECQNAAGCCSSGSPGDGADGGKSGPRLQMNCGNNRFNCFGCDYDVCKECLDEAAVLYSASATNVQQQQHQHQQQLQLQQRL